MKMTLGPFEVPVDLPDQLNKKLLDLTIRDLQNAAMGNPPRLHVEERPRLKSVEELMEDLRSDAGISDLALLKASGFTEHTIVMLVRKLLGINSSGSQLIDKMPEIKEQALLWLERPLNKEHIWGIFLEQVMLPKVGPFTAAIGLNENNQMIILDLITETNIERLQARGLNTKKIKFVMLSPGEFQQKQIRALFPSAKVQIDWLKFIDSVANEKIKNQLSELMYVTEPNLAMKSLAKLKAPLELLTYYNFDKDLWRALRAATSVHKMETELKSRTKLKLLRTAEQKRFIIAFTLLRLQYHWLKIPVDSENLNNLRHIKMRLEEA